MQKDLLLTTRLFDVERRVFPRAGQTPVKRDVVVHPGAVVILPVLEDGRLVLIRNYRYPVEKELLELAAGTREPDEAPLETARRELEEETGYRAGVIEPLTEFYTSPGILTERMYAYLATDLTEAGQNLQGAEQITVVLLEPGEVLRMLQAGELEDGKTVAVLGLYFARQQVRKD